MADELYLKYRPTKPSEIVGQSGALKSLADMAKRGVVPHALLFTGPSGCGKTTLARMLAKRLGCDFDFDFREINAASLRGIDDVRAIHSTMGVAPMGGPCTIYLLDECHQLTGAAQDAFLKPLEDTPKHVYFFFATTDPQKLKTTIKTRCTEIKCSALSESELKAALERVCKLEEKEIHPEVLDSISEAAQGSARKALVILHSVFGLPDKESQLASIFNPETKNSGYEIAQALMNKSTTWEKMRTLLSTVEESEFETVRRICLGYAKSCLLKSDNARAGLVIQAFWEPLYDIGFPGLVSVCYEIIKG